jgi:DNA gyrase subunit A
MSEDNLDPQSFPDDVKNARISEREITEEMETSYIEYAMMTIVGRALPDARDGLKPVHRRILYAMDKLGLTAGGKFVKSARITGEVIGKYHPHGDTAVYYAMVRLAQDFSLRYPLVKGQGNFGSIDGDNPAAMRYTEAKMTRIAEDILIDLNKDTVDFRDNYDGSLQEPTVLPTRVPNLIINGSMGIAVGMATNIPPHNLSEIIDACMLLIQNPDADIDALCEIVKGPDFPTAGYIYDQEVIKNIYKTGRGSVIMRGKAEIQEKASGRSVIIITEIPYQVNKSDMIIKIASLVKEEKIDGISGIRDESSKGDIRVVIELKKDAHPKKVLNTIYKMSTLQTSFGVNMVALIDDGKQPQLLNLKIILDTFLQHRFTVVTRRTKYQLREAEARAHILEGLKIALDNIDEVIKLIRGSSTKEEAQAGLEKTFKLSEKQAHAILQMRLQTLAGLERKKIEEELAELQKYIEELKTLLGDKTKMWTVISGELEEIKAKYGDDRKTRVQKEALGAFRAKDTIPNDEMIVTMTEVGYIKRTIVDSYRKQHRGGKGSKSMNTKKEDVVKCVLHTYNHNDLLFFTNTGRVFILPAYEIPQTERTARGAALVNLLQLGPKEKIITILDISAQENMKHLLFATKNGLIKKTDIEAYKNIRNTGLIALGIRDGDDLLSVQTTNGDNEIMMMSNAGKSIRFDENDIRSTGRSASGVRGMKMKKNEVIIAMDVVSKIEEGYVCCITSHGYGKKTKLKEYRTQSRGGSGIKTATLTKKNGILTSSFIVPKEEKGDIIVISQQGQIIRTDIDSLSILGRATQGVSIMRIKENDNIVSTSFIKNIADTQEAEVESKKVDMFAETK